MSLFDTLKSAGLPVISASDDGSVVMGDMTEAQETLYNDTVLSYFNPSGYNDLVLSRSERQTIRQEVQNMITRLDQIQAATNPTNAQVIQAVKDEALYIERILRFLVRIV